MATSFKAESLKSGSSGFQHGAEDKMLLREIDPVEERRVVRKMDYCLIPIMTLFYLLSFLVRAINMIKANRASKLTDANRTERILVCAYSSFAMRATSLTSILPGNAKVAGLQADLGLTDHQYQICVTILYVYVYVLYLGSLTALITVI